MTKKIAKKLLSVKDIATHWTPEMDERMRQLRADGFGWVEISNTMKWSINAVRARAWSIGLYKSHDRLPRDLKTWTKAQEERLFELKKRGLSCVQIASALGKTKNAVLGRLMRERTGGNVAFIKGTIEQRAEVLGRATGISGAEVIGAGWISNKVFG